MNDRFIKKISINWNEIEEDTYLREIPALQFEEFLTFDRNVTFLRAKMVPENPHYLKELLWHMVLIRKAVQRIIVFPLIFPL